MVSVSVTIVSKDVPVSASDIKKAVQYVCLGESVKEAELSFVFINDGRIRTINRKFLKHDYVTDVITFPLEKEKVSAEIYINGRQAQRQAREHHVSVRNELIRLAVHGTLHAIGYQDTTTATRKRMEKVQERYVSELSMYL